MKDICDIAAEGNIPPLKKEDCEISPIHSTMLPCVIPKRWGKPYSIIYADPAWQFKNYSDSWHEKAKDSRWVARHYQITSTEDICKMPVQNIADKNAVLLMWATFPRLPDALEVIRAWGFTYKTQAFTWIKKNKRSAGNFWGMGYYTRSNAEVCLLATRGKPLQRLSHSVHSVIEAPIGKHSEKPAEVRERIVELFGDLPRIEMFARQAVAGWDVFGNQAPGSIKLEDSQ